MLLRGQAYNWSIPQGWTIVDGQGSHTITVNANDQEGTLSVTAENACGVGEPKELAISIIEDDGTFTFWWKLLPTKPFTDSLLMRPLTLRLTGAMEIQKPTMVMCRLSMTTAKQVYGPSKSQVKRHV